VVGDEVGPRTLHRVIWRRSAQTSRRACRACLTSPSAVIEPTALFHAEFVLNAVQLDLHGGERLTVQLQSPPASEKTRTELQSLCQGDGIWGMWIASLFVMDPQIATCDRCGAQAPVAAALPIFGDGGHEDAGFEQPPREYSCRIDCPRCGLRTQVVRVVAE
jgi:hypothetical protein